MRATARYVDGSGNALEVYFDAGDMVASQFGSTKSLGAWNGTTLTVGFVVSFRWLPTAALPVLWTYLFTEAALLTRACVDGDGQSNIEGRANAANCRAIAHATRILRASHPYDPNLTGPGHPSSVGPLLLYADLLASHYDRVYITCKGTGSQTVAQLWGTNGEDGTHATQRNHAEVCRGRHDNNPPCFIRPGDHLFHFSAHGEADTVTAPADYAADWQELLDHIPVEYPGVVQKARTIFRLSPSAPDNLFPSVSNPDWHDIRDAIATLHNPGGSPPQFVIDYRDTDRISGDLNHVDVETTQPPTRGWDYLANLAYTTHLQAGILP